MDIEQKSVDGNLKSIMKVFTKALGYTPQQLTNGLFMVGEDQLLLDHIHSIQLLRDSDILGEDFKFVLPVLGPLYTIMNKKKLIMRHHLSSSIEQGTLIKY